MKSAAEKGRWPASVPGVFTSTKVGAEGYRKTHAFTMAPALIPVFRAAIQRHDRPSAGDPQAIVGHLAGLYEEMGHPAHLARELAEDFLDQHAGDLALWAVHRMAFRDRDDATVIARPAPAPAPEGSHRDRTDRRAAKIQGARETLAALTAPGAAPAAAAVDRATRIPAAAAPHGSAPTAAAGRPVS
ncbi:hypothetical protein [Streptomyces goshikiensis]